MDVIVVRTNGYLRENADPLLGKLKACIVDLMTRATLPKE